MSEIRNPAQSDSPDAPGDQGQSSEPTPGNDAPPRRDATDEDAPTPGNERTPGHGDEADDGPAPGNEAPQPEGSGSSTDEEEDPADSIGNRIDAPGAAGNAQQARQGQGPGQGPGQAQGPGQGQGQGQGKNKRRRGKGGDKQGPRPQGQGQGGGGGGGGGQAGGDKGGDPNARRAFHVGDKVRAKIVSIGAAGAIVDLWGKENGVLDLREIVTAETPEPKVGDGVDVVVVQDGARGGNLVVTRDPSRADRGREMLAQAFNDNEPIEGLVTGVNRGGLEVDLSGVRGFCPSSQIDVRFPPTYNPKTLVLTRQMFKVTSLAESGREAIVSRRAVLEHEVRARAEEAKQNIKIGSTVKGIVVAVKEYGVFVDLGGIEGMIHISELTHNRGARPQDVVKVGEEIEAKVLRISGGQSPQQEKEAGKKDGARGEHTPQGGAEAAGDGEAHAEATPPAHEEAEGGPEIELSAEGEGESEATAEGGATPEGGKKPEGGKRDKRDKKQQFRRGVESLPRVVLSRRAIEPDPWAGIEKRFPPGSVHAGKVARMQPFGAFIELTPGVDGLLHVSELGDGGKRIEHPNEVLKEGQAVNVRVERVERGAKRISLSLLPEGVTEADLKKAVTPRMGMIVKAKIVEHDAHGMWAQIEGSVGKSGRGFIAPPDSNQPRGTDLRRAIPVGTEVTVKIVEVDRGRPKLSIRAALHDEERQAYRAYQKEATSKTVGTSLADKLRAKLGNFNPGGKNG